MPAALPRLTMGVACLAASLAAPTVAYELVNQNGLHAEASLNARLGLRQGYHINFGFGALTGFGELRHTTGETERTDLQLSLKPSLKTDYTIGDSKFYGGVSVVAATTTLDGELSGQFARSGDRALDTDAAYVGWQRGVLDLSYGGQPFTLGDGLVVGDGNFNRGDDDGQYWIGAFESWRNTAILKLNTAPIRADVFWLRTDQDLGDSRVIGLNLENSQTERWGKLSVMAFEIIGDRGVGLEGMKVRGIRGGDLHLPTWTGFRLFGEYVHQAGQSDLTRVDNDAAAWYIEPSYQFLAWRWAPRFYYRHSHYSGDDSATPDNEEYRGLFFTFGKRDWDTWYQGEINGEFFLFNQNQVTHMLKVKAYPNARCAVMVMAYHHELDTPQYFGLPTTSTNWSDEVNLEFEFYPDDKLYGLAGIAWAKPNRGAKDIFGDDPQLVLELFLSYTFK